MENSGAGLREYLLSEENSQKRYYKYPSKKEWDELIKLLNTPQKPIIMEHFISKPYMESLSDIEFMYLCDNYKLIGGEEAVDYTTSRYAELKSNKHGK